MCGCYHRLFGLSRVISHSEIASVDFFTHRWHSLPADVICFAERGGAFSFLDDAKKEFGTSAKVA
jgi:hypothetical protein